MKYLSDEKLLIVGAGGMIGSNMAQTALMLGLTPNICLYDIFEPGVHGVAEEIYHCAFEGANVTWTTDPAVAFKDAKYIISSGGAPRKEGMTREDLLKGNCKIAAEFGDLIKKYCPDVKHVVVIFNPADVTALTALIHSGLKPNQLTSLAALDSTRLQEGLAQEFGVQQCKVTNAYTYGGHGEAMAVFASKALIDGTPLAEKNLSAERWAEIKHNTIQGGSIEFTLVMDGYQGAGSNSSFKIAGNAGQVYGNRGFTSLRANFQGIKLDILYNSTKGGICSSGRGFCVGRPGRHKCWCWNLHGFYIGDGQHFHVACI